MHLCTSVIEEGGDGEDASSETPSLLSYTLRYVSFGEVGRMYCGILWPLGLGGGIAVINDSVVYYESMKRKVIQNLYMNVGVMKDYKLRDLRASHTLGWSWNWNT